MFRAADPDEPGVSLNTVNLNNEIRITLAVKKQQPTLWSSRWILRNHQSLCLSQMLEHNQQGT
jgi:hypothetical protein